MSTYVVRDANFRAFVRRLCNTKLPFTATVVKGELRSLAQNRLQMKWIKEISEQLGDQTPEYIRAFNKLTLGVPILRAENEIFRDVYDRIIRPMPYEDKIAMMMEPLDFAVTRLMTVKQKTAFLDAVHQYWSEKGVVLTDPEMLKYQDGFGEGNDVR